MAGTATIDAVVPPQAQPGIMPGFFPHEILRSLE
jgi:hypothetical protein